MTHSATTPVTQLMVTSGTVFLLRKSARALIKTLGQNGGGGSGGVSGGGGGLIGRRALNQGGRLLSFSL